MFFTNAGLVIAWLLFVPSTIFLIIVMIAAMSNNYAAFHDVFGPRFLASSNTYIQGVALGVTFGIAAEISRSIAARSASDKDTPKPQPASPDEL